MAYSYLKINGQPVVPIAIVDSSSNQVDTFSGGAVTQSGTWTVQPGNTANTTPWMVDGQALTPATVQATASGNTTIVTPTSGKKIKLYRIEFANAHATAAVTVGWRFAAAGTIYGKKYVAAVGGQGVSNFGANWVQGATNEALIINLSGASTIEVTAYYTEIA